MSAFDRFIAALEAADCRQGRGWLCPAHDDRNPSLSIKEGDDGRVLVKCFARCPTEEIVAALGFEMGDLFEQRGDEKRISATYDYTDENGKLLFQAVRFDPKDFRQRRSDGNGNWIWNLKRTRRVLYRLPKVIEAAKAGETIYLVEGEKDVHAIERAGGVATCNPMGAGKWRPEYAEILRGADVVVVADRDQPGRDHAAQIVSSLTGIATIRLVEPAAGDDAADHLAAGKGLDQFIDAERSESQVSTLTNFSDVVAKPVRWAWRHRIAQGKITGLAGRPKIGKGLLYSELIGRVTRGDLDGDLDGPRNVIIVTTEDEPGDTLKPRLIAAGADLSRVSYFQMGTADDPVPFRVPKDANELGRRVVEKQAALVVIDPLIEFIDGKADSHKSKDVRQAIAALNQIAKARACAILVVIHLNKGVSTDPLLRHEASAAFTQVLRGTLMLGRDPDDPEGEGGNQRVLAVTSSNLAREAPSLAYRIETRIVDGDTGEPIETARIVCIGESSASGSDLLAGALDDDDRADQDEATDFLRSELAGGLPVPANQVQKAAKAAGIGPWPLKRAKRKLSVKSSKSGMESGWVWQLPEGDAPKGMEATSPEASPSSPSPFHAVSDPSEGADSPEGDESADTASSHPLRTSERRGCASHLVPHPACRYCRDVEDFEQRLEEKRRGSR